MTNSMTLNQMNFDNFETLSETELNLALGGKSGAYTAGYYVGKTVNAIGTIAGIVAILAL